MNQQASVWLSTVDQLQELRLQQPVAIREAAPHQGSIRIQVNPEVRYQAMDGFGASFTDASAYLMYRVLDGDSRREVMTRLFDPEAGIGISFLRQPMGATDYTTEIYSYDDMPEGQEDFGLEHFSIDHDRAYVIPAVLEALRLNPAIKVMASPWSPPGWMKTSGHMVTGKLRPECYGVYAQYFVKFVQAYEEAGIPIYAVSIQNEPGYEPKEYPGMLLTPQEEAAFIRDHLGPAFEAAGIQAKILCYDHNWDVPQHPLGILDDPGAARYVAGVAWHVYGGEHEAMTQVKEAHPDKEAWFTEASGGSWIPPFRTAFLDQMKHVIRTTRNWSKSVVWWNLALDEHNGPTVLSNSTCRGLVQIHQATGSIKYELDYYTMGHISKFVVPGAYRIGSTTFRDELESTAFLNPDGTTVLILSNRTEAEQLVEIDTGRGFIGLTLPDGAAATVTW
ncbi:glycoside hydrolase family 30 beta sandwich domain-containing protein [Paenibacillus chibensis]|uniref:Glycoside hydrolase family 30 beta sandwich domain-containing protein n=1 Tax=Paenibacillus chibensis TaxID=59846 RepID=A0ABU6PPH2_9BACL|nr:glycoside hydrolase family 30 beta sandwich domain-containing protein [Paenibacillus chibensis]